MQMMSLRFFIVPLGAVCTLIALGLQDVPARADRDGATMSTRQQVNDCSRQRVADICVLSSESNTSSR